MDSLAMAKKEFEILEKVMGDALVLPYKEEILALVKKFGESGQSGGSAPYISGAIKDVVGKLLLRQPITPLTGDDSEWMHCNESCGFQNTRQSAVFKKDGVAIYVNAIVFRGDLTGTFASGSISIGDGKTISSKQKIKSFPFKPKVFYIDVIETEWADKEGTEKKKGGGWWTAVVKDIKQLDAVREYYDMD